MNFMGISSFLALSQYLGQFLAFEGEKKSISKFVQILKNGQKSFFSLEKWNFFLPHLSPLPKHPIEASFFLGEIEKKSKKTLFSDIFWPKFCTIFNFDGQNVHEI